MSAKNLAVIFGPSLVRPRAEEVQYVLGWQGEGEGLEGRGEGEERGGEEGRGVEWGGEERRRGEGRGGEEGRGVGEKEVERGEERGGEERRGGEGREESLCAGSAKDYTAERTGCCAQWGCLTRCARPSLCASVV